jgi:hypothetical protein
MPRCAVASRTDEERYQLRDAHFVAISCRTKFLEYANLTYYGIAIMGIETTLPASRARLAAVLRATTEVMSRDIAAQTLDLDRAAAVG